MSLFLRDLQQHLKLFGSIDSLDADITASIDMIVSALQNKKTNHLWEWWLRC
jgi:hypothetical protein